MEITLFSIWHFLYLILIIGGTIGTAFIFKNRSEKTKKIALQVYAYLVLFVYLIDFFIQPLVSSSGRLDIDKLPFHICTLMAIFIPLVQFNKRLSFLKECVVALSIVSALMYMVYPGSALGGVAPWSYKVIQTFLYHGLTFVWGFLSLSTKQTQLHIKRVWIELVFIVGIALWAALGNFLYTNPTHHYDWFFITGSTFPFIPSWIMPFVVVVAVFGMVVLIYGIYYLVLKIAKEINKRKVEKQQVVQIKQEEK